MRVLIDHQKHLTTKIKALIAQNSGTASEAETSHWVYRLNKFSNAAVGAINNIL